MSKVYDQSQVTERVPEVTASDDTDAAAMARKLQDLQTATQTLVRAASTGVGSSVSVLLYLLGFAGFVTSLSP